MVTNTPYDEIEGREKQYLETCRLKQDIKSAVVTYWLINLTDETGAEGVRKTKTPASISMLSTSRGYSRCIKKEATLINFGY